jgi:predicted PurR-regulated permease PerM
MKQRKKTILKIINFIATMLPPLAIFLKRIADELSTDIQNSDAIIQRQLQDTKDNEVQVPPSYKNVIEQEKKLKQIEHDLNKNREQIQKRSDRMQKNEMIVFYFMLVSAIVSIILIVLGAFLFFKKGTDITAVLSTFVGILAGTGTAILRQLQKYLKEEIGKLLILQEKDSDYLRRIEIALAFEEGPERAQRIVETISKLQENIKTN